MKEINRRRFNKMKFKWDRASIAAVGLVVLVVLIRLMLLEWNPDRLSPDHSIVSLMSKHIYEKGEYPIFFYGQNWFGSIESFMHAFFFSIFGVSTKVLGYAPLFFFSLFLIILYLLARDLYGPSIALWSMAYFIVPPIHLLDYSLNPQGGYVETLTFGALVFWLTIRFIRATVPCHPGWLFSLGFAAGLGWWTSPLTIYFIFTSFIFILLERRLKLFDWKILLGLAGFFVGSFPFWLFHILYQQDLGGFSSGLHPSIIPRGLHALFSHDIPAMLDWKYFKREGLLCSVSFLAFYIGSAGIFIYRTGGDFMKLFRLKNFKAQGKGILLLFLIVFCAIYASSQHSLEKRERYVLPLFIFFPIAAGHFFSWLSGHNLKRVFIWLTAACFIFTEVSLFERYAKANKHDYKRKLALQNLENFMLKRKLLFCYADYGHAPIFSFLSKERIIASTLGYEKYPPYQSWVDQAFAPAILLQKNAEEEKTVAEGMNYLGGSLKIGTVSGFMILHAYEAPKAGYREISSENWKARASHNSKDAGFACDKDANRKWDSLESKQDQMFFELDLGKEYVVGMIRLWNHPRHFYHYPSGFKLESSSDGTNWHPLLEAEKLFSFYWSGPRLYPWDTECRLEMRFKPARMRYIRLNQLGTDSQRSWGINEIFVYEFSQNIEDDADISALIAHLESRGIKFIYADSWLSFQIPSATGGKIKSIHGYEPAAYRSGEKNEQIVEFGPDRAFILGKEDAVFFQTELKKLANDLLWPEMMDSISEKAFGQNIVFMFKPWTKRHEENLKKIKSYYWTGFCAVRADSYASRDLTSIADMHYQAEDFSTASKFYRKAIAIFPENLLPYNRLSNIKQKIPWPKASEEKTRMTFLNNQPVSVLFEKDLLLTGYQWASLENPALKFSKKTPEFRKMEKTAFRLTWKKSILHPLPNVSVFIHIENGNAGFQADHTLLINRDDAFEIPEQVFLNKHAFEIPSNIPPGTYSIYAGLYTKDRRLRIIKSDRPHQRERAYLGEVKILD
jgi:hypothetical protein